MRASITFAAGQSSEIGRYEIPREESLPGFRIRMAIDDFQIAGIRHDVTRVVKDLMRSKNTSGYFALYIDNISITTYST